MEVFSGFLLSVFAGAGDSVFVVDATFGGSGVFSDFISAFLRVAVSTFAHVFVFSEAFAVSVFVDASGCDTDSVGFFAVHADL